MLNKLPRLGAYK